MGVHYGEGGRLADERTSLLVAKTKNKNQKRKKKERRKEGKKEKVQGNMG